MVVVLSPLTRNTLGGEARSHHLSDADNNKELVSLNE
jgi:hypothetical protein